MAGSDPTPQQWAATVLHALGIHQTPGAIQALTGWAKAEGGHWNNDAKYNPLNTTQPMPGAGNTGTQGNIKVYRNWQQGVDATVRTLRNGRYGGILRALGTGDPRQVATAIGQTPWGTSGGLVTRTIMGTPAASGVHGLDLGGSSPSSSPSPGAASSTTTTTPGVDNSQVRAGLIQDFLGRKNADPLQFALGIRGAQDVPGTTTSTSSPTASPSSSSPSGHSSGGYVNPFGSSLVAPGRIDEGVDPTIKGPIRAIGDAKIVNLSHNFYKGQPYLVYQLTSGPHAGKYVFVSELISPHVKVGDTVRAGDVIATGHGAIETGWAGGAKGAYMPLANRAQGGDYTEGKVTGHGRHFAQFLKSLGANAAR